MELRRVSSYILREIYRLQRRCHLSPYTYFPELGRDKEHEKAKDLNGLLDQIRECKSQHTGDMPCAAERQTKCHSIRHDLEDTRSPQELE